MTMPGPDWEQVAAEADEGLAPDVGDFMRRFEQDRVVSALLVYAWRMDDGDICYTTAHGGRPLDGLGLARYADKAIMEDWRPCDTGGQ